MNVKPQWTIALALLLDCTVSAAQPRGGNAMPLPRLVPVTDDVYVIKNENTSIGELISYGGNLTMILTSEGVVLIDAKTAQLHDFVVEQVRSVGDLPITHVVLTHHHNDHSGGLARLQEIGATAIISEALRERMNPQQGAGPSTQSYSGELTLTSGETKIHLYEIQGHTAGDTVAYLPEAGVLIAGDLITTADTIPVIVNYEDGGSWTSLGAALERLAEFDFEYLISGHGPVINRSEFLAFRDKVAGIIETTRLMSRDGASREAVAEALLAEYNWGGGLATGNIPVMMQELR